MKRLLFILILLSGLKDCFSQSNTVSYQDTNKITRQRWRDTCFGLINLSSSQIPSGYLIDYSLMALNDSAFNGVYSANDTISESGQFFALENLLADSKVNSNGTLPNSTDTLFINANRYQRDSSKIPILFLFQPYQKIRPTSLSEGLFTLTTDSVRLMDVSGRQTSPYDTKTLFAFTPLQNSINQFNSISFSLPAQFWLMNGITSVQIDFGDGLGYRTLSKNQSVNVYYNTVGTKYITAIISTSYGTLTAKSSINYTTPPAYFSPDTSFSISVPPVYTGISQYLNQGNTPTGNPCSEYTSILNKVNCDINPGAQITITKSCDNLFDKPIIIVEPFDAGTPLNADQLQTYFSGGQSGAFPFYADMLGQGYDFVFVIFTDDETYIENNAKVLEQVIDFVNSRKVGTNKNTVIGYSMGGLVARWCLADMESRGINHQVGSFFSYDAPQQGANIPLGLQFGFSELIHDVPELKWSKSIRAITEAYTSVAAREMLVTLPQYDNNFNPLSYTLDPIRNIFAQNLITKGYPQLCTNYGISLGRGNNTSGTTNAGNGVQFGNFVPGSDIFDGSLTLPLIYANLSAYASPQNSNALITSYSSFSPKVVKIFGIRILPVEVLRSRNIYYNGLYPYDNAPGAFESTQWQFQDDFNHAIKRFWSILGVSATGTDNNHDGHAFVPVPSALDLQNQGYSSSDLFQSNNLFYNIDNLIVNPGQVTGNNLSQPSLSPFKYVLTYTSDCGAVTCQSLDFYNNVGGTGTVKGSNWNQWHEDPVSNQAKLFMERKILNQVLNNNCNSFCSSQFSINSSNSPICSTATLTLTSSTNKVTGYNINWTFQNGYLTITNGQGTPKIVVTPSSQYVSGTETVTATLTNQCGQQYHATYQVNVGNPLTGTINQGGNLTSMNTVNYISSGATSVTFQWPGVTGISCYQSSTNPPISQTGFIYYPSQSKFWFTLSSGQSITVSFSGTGCNGSTIATRTFTVGGHYYAVSPNPATSSITISPSTQSNALESVNTQSSSGSGIRLVTISDVTGVVKQRKQFAGNTNTVQVDVSNLPQGTYFVQISDGHSIDTQQLIINR